MKFKLTANTHVGEVRDHNEDNFFICSDLATDDWSFDKSIEYELGDLGSILIVADGMGGMNAGEVASAIAVESSKSYFTDNKGSVNIESEDAINEFLKNTIVHAHQEILQHQNSHPETAGMGTTLIIGWVINGVAYVGWCGDSRAYLYNPNLSSSGRAKQFEDLGLRVKGDLALVSKDHSYVQTLVDKGDLNYSQAFFHPESNIITQSLGQSGQDIAPSTTSFTLFEGDMLILCSDGINAMLEDGQIETICSENNTASDISSQLISNANEKGGHDNSTVTIFHTLNASHSIDNPLASAIKRDLNERKAPKSNFLKMIVLVLLIGGTLGALYSSFKDNLNLGVLPENTSEEFLVLESELNLEDRILHAEDTVFYAEKPGRLKVFIGIDDLMSVTALDTSAFENEIPRYFYINDKSKVEDDNTPDKIVDEVAPDAGIKEESSNIESLELKASESEKAETVSTTSNGEWRVQLHARRDFEDKRKKFKHLKIDHSEILVRWDAEESLWKYYSRCFESSEEASEWKKRHFSTSKDKPFLVNGILCDLEDQSPESIKKTASKTTSKLEKQKPNHTLNKLKIESGEKENEVESANDQESKTADEVISTLNEEEQLESQSLQPDSNAEKSDTSKTEDDKNI